MFFATFIEKTERNLINFEQCKAALNQICCLTKVKEIALPKNFKFLHQVAAIALWMRNSRGHFYEEYSCIYNLYHFFLFILT